MNIIETYDAEDYKEGSYEAVMKQIKHAREIESRYKTLPDLVSPLPLKNTVNEFANYILNDSDTDAIKKLNQLYFQTNIKKRFDKDKSLEKHGGMKIGDTGELTEPEGFNYKINQKDDIATVFGKLDDNNTPDLFKNALKTLQANANEVLELKNDEKDIKNIINNMEAFIKAKSNFLTSMKDKKLKDWYSKAPGFNKAYSKINNVVITITSMVEFKLNKLPKKDILKYLYTTYKDTMNKAKEVGIQDMYIFIYNIILHDLKFNPSKEFKNNWKANYLELDFTNLEHLESIKKRNERKKKARETKRLNPEATSFDPLSISMGLASNSSKVKQDVFDYFDSLSPEPKQIAITTGLMSSFKDKDTFLKFINEKKDYLKNPLILAIVQDLNKNAHYKDIGIYNELLLEYVKKNKNYFVHGSPTYMDLEALLGNYIKIGAGPAYIVPDLTSKKFNYNINELLNDLIRLKVKSQKDFEKALKDKYSSMSKVKNDVILHINNFFKSKKDVYSKEKVIRNAIKAFLKKKGSKKNTIENRNRLLNFVFQAPNHLKLNVLNYIQDLIPYNMMSMNKKKFDIKYGIADVMRILSSTFDSNVKRSPNNPFYINVPKIKREDPKYWRNKVYADIFQVSHPDKYFVDIFNVFKKKKLSNAEALYQVAKILSKYHSGKDVKKISSSSRTDQLLSVKNILNQL